MESNLTTAKIVGDADIFHWGGVFAENGLFIVLEISGSEEKHAVNTGREILDLLLTKFTNIEARTLETVVQLLSLAEEKSEISSLVIGLLEKNSLFLSCLKDGYVYLKRGERFGSILNTPTRVKGVVENQDILFISSKTFNLLVTKEKVYNSLELDDPEQIATQLAPQILENKDALGACALVVKISPGLTSKVMPPNITGWKNRLREKLNSASEKAQRLLKKRNLPWLKQPQELQDPEKIRTKKTLLTVSISLVVLLIFSVFFNINHTQDVKRREKLDEVLALVTQQYEEASNLIDLNPGRSRELLESSKLSLAPLLGEFPKNSDEFKTTTEWIGKISSQEVIAYKIYKLTAVPVFFDLSLVKNGGEGKKMAGYKDTKVILDTKNKVVYTLSTVTKQSAIVAGGDTVKEAQAITVHGNNAYILNSDGVVSIDIPSRSAKVVIKPDEKWGDIGSLESFGGNLYLLDRKNNTIWKYIATDFGFSSRTTYLNPDVRANFANSLKMVVDGSVWVMDPAEITKYTRGLSEQFAFKGFSETLHNIISISSSDTDNFIYLLDRETARVVVFDKDGSYQSQYQWDELLNADDMVATEEEKEIFVLAGSKIYAIDIK